MKPLVLLQFLWRAHPPVTLAVGADATACMSALIAAARPSQRRLHLRDLFAEGRRYHVQPRAGGFRMTSDSKHLWRRGRTRITAVIEGNVTHAGEALTYVRLRARMGVAHLLGTLFIPAFFTSIVVYMPWHPAVIAGISAALFALSWLSLRFDAALQANAMIFFVQKALEDLPPAQISELESTRPDVLTFQEAWRRAHEDRAAQP